MAFDQNAVLRVEVVAADHKVWEGDAESVVARTVEGDIGILKNHESLIAALVPCAAEVRTISGENFVFALDGGFLSVEDNRVLLLSQFARSAEGLNLDRARQDVAAIRDELPPVGQELTAEQESALAQAIGELRAAEKVARVQH